MPIRFGLVGCGTVAQFHAAALAEVEGASLAAVASRTARHAEAFARERGIQWHARVEELLARPDIDAASICTPSGDHADVAIAAMRAGKHVVVEKPLATTLEQADAVLEVSRQTGRALAVISQLRFAPEVREVQTAVAGGSLGRLLLADLSMKYHRSQQYYDSAGWRGTWAMDGGGALMNQGIHGIDLLLWLAGAPRTICGYARTLARRIEVEDTAVAVAELEGGCLATITATTSVSPGFPRRLSLHGERGTIVLEETRVVLWEIQGEPGRAVEAAGAPGTARVPTAVGQEEFTAQYRAIVANLREGRTPPVSAVEARTALATVLAIYESSRTGHPVTL